MSVRVELPVMSSARSWTEAANDPRAIGEAKEALLAFEQILGANWSGWSESPLARQFFVPFQHCPPEGARFLGMIRALDGVPLLHQFVRETLGGHTWQDYVAGVMGLEFCSRMRASGSDVAFIARTHEKSADARIKFVDRWVTVEFKAMHEHDEAQVWHQFDVQLMRTLGPHEVNPASFDIELTDLALTDRDAVAEGLRQLWADQQRDWRDLPRGTGRARIARGQLALVSRPYSQQDELDRLAGRLAGKWSRQLAQVTEPTLIVVEVRSALARSRPSHVPIAAMALTAAVGPVLQQRPQIGGVLAYDEPFGAPVRPAWQDFGTFRVRMDTSPWRTPRYMALVPNPGASVPLLGDELDRLVAREIAW